jgi:hypothetical protein
LARYYQILTRPIPGMVSIICVICCQLAKFILKGLESVINQHLWCFVQAEIVAA